MYRFLPNLVTDSRASLTGVYMRATTPTMFSPDGVKLFEPDTLVPEQFYATIRRTQCADPERRLMAAVLEDAVSCLSANPPCAGRKRRYFEEAQSWINATEEQEWIFSFTNVCETLGLDPSFLRRGLNRWSSVNEKGWQPLRLKKYRSGARRRKLRFRSTI
jgi:hypothetical protein